MIDTIHIKVKLEDVSEEVLEKIPTTFDQHTGVILPSRGKLENLILDVYYDNLYVKGSIAKYLNRENLTILSGSQLSLALNKLSSQIGADLNKMEIIRIDFGLIIKNLKNPVQSYFDCLTNYPRLKRVLRHSGETLSFNSTTRCIQIYDKLKEMKIKNNNYSNIIRFEIQLKKRIGHWLRRKVYCSDLFDIEFLIRLNKMIEEYFNTIIKVEPKTEVNLKYTSLNEYSKILMMIGLKTFSHEERESLLRNNKKNCSYQIQKRIKKLNRELLQINNDNSNGDLSELISGFEKAVSNNYKLINS